MRYLLDTHVFIWMQTNPKRLPSNIRKELENPEHQLYVSVVSAWEIAIKASVRSDFILKVPLDELFSTAGLLTLDVTLDHVNRLQQLPLLHKDPFDRMLIAQAKVEGCRLITADRKITAYEHPVLFVE